MKYLDCLANRQGIKNADTRIIGIILFRHQLHHARLPPLRARHKGRTHDPLLWGAPNQSNLLSQIQLHDVRGTGKRKFVLKERPTDAASLHQGEGNGVGGGGKDVDFTREGREPSAFEPVGDAFEAALQQSRGREGMSREEGGGEGGEEGKGGRDCSISARKMKAKQRN